MNSHEIERVLAGRFAAPEWALLFQVRNGTGFQRQVRTADALAMSLYPSRGLHLHGIEIKVSKGDWKRELENPDKAEEIARFCHFWHIVSPEGVVPVDEIPAAWGLWEVVEGKAGHKLRNAKAAERRDAEPLSWLMLASMFRNVQGRYAQFVTPETVEALVAERTEKRVEAETHQLRRAHDALKEELGAYREFERVAGIRVDKWNGGRIAAAVQEIVHGRTDPENYVRRLGVIEDNVSGLLDQVRESILRLEKGGA